MKRIILVIIVLLPFVAAAQNGISKKQSRYRLDALKRLEQTYSYLGGQHSGNLVVVGKDDLFGVVDFEGRTVIPLQYDWVAPALNGERFLLFSDTLMGIADRSGRMVVPMEYDAELYAEDEAVTFRYGLIIMSKGGKYGVLDTAGRTVVPMVYDEWLWLVDSNLMILQGYNHQIRQPYEILMQLDGDTVIPTQSFINWWDENLFRVQNDKELWGLCDRSGRVVVACQYDDYIDYPHNGLATVKKGGRTGVIDIRGHEVIPVAENRFGGKTPYPQTRNLFVLEKNGRVGAVDSLGNTVIPFEYDFNPEGSASHLVLVRGDTAYFLFDNTGHLISTYDNFYSYSDCDASGPQLLFAVSRNGLWGLVDTAWREVAPCTYKGADFVDGRHWLMRLDEGTSCLVDEQGQVLFKGPYSYAYPFCDGIWHVGILDCANNNYILGYVDAYGQTTLSRKELKEMERIMIECAKKEKEPTVETTVREADETIHTDTISTVGIASDEEEIDEVFVFVENQPEFPGGDSALFMFICMNLSYPDQARDNGLEGLVWVRFVVEKDGTISNVMLVRDIGGGCGQAAVEMVKSMPRWKPATQSGKPVNCEFILPVKFQLTDDEPDGTHEEKCLFQYNSNWKK